MSLAYNGSSKDYLIPICYYITLPGKRNFTNTIKTQRWEDFSRLSRWSQCNLTESYKGRTSLPVIKTKEKQHENLTNTFLAIKLKGGYRWLRICWWHDLSITKWRLIPPSYSHKDQLSIKNFPTNSRMENNMKNAFNFRMSLTRVTTYKNKKTLTWCYINHCFVGDFLQLKEKIDTGNTINSNTKTNKQNTTKIKFCIDIELSLHCIYHQIFLNVW